MVSYLHGIVVELATEGLVRRPVRSCERVRTYEEAGERAPNHASLPYETIATKRDNYGVSGIHPPQVTANDGTAGDDRLPAEDDVLRPSYGRATRDLVACVLLVSKRGKCRTC